MNNLDQRFDAWVDRLCKAAPDRFRSLYIRFSHTHIGWHLLAVAAALGQGFGGLVQNVSSEDQTDLFLAGASEAFFAWLETLLSGWKEKLGVLLALDDAGMVARFWMLLYLLGMSAIGIVKHESRELCVISAALCLAWVSVCFTLRYRPVCGSIRQKHIVSRAFRGAASALRLLVWFELYVAYGIASNIMLQSMMLVFLATHLAVFFAVIAFNKRQNLFLRLLDGLLGSLPALGVSAATALLVSNLNGSLTVVASACMRAFGAMMLFLADRVESLVTLGNTRFDFSKLTIFLLDMGGCLFVLAAAWVAA